MEKLKELTINMLNNENKNKKFLVWSIVFFCYPFIITILYGLFAESTILIKNLTINTIIESVTDFMSSYIVLALSFLVSFILSITELHKTKWKSLFAIFITAISLLLSFACFYLYF